MLVATDFSQKFRSTLELGAVVSIIMLLTALALKNFETTIIRTQLSEAFSLASTVRGEMVVYRAQHGYWPKTEAALHNSTLSEENGLGKYVERMALNENGSFSTFFGGTNTVSHLSGRQLTMRPMLVSGSPGSPVVWACAGYGVPQGMVAGGPDKTDIDIAYLPASCRDY